MTRFREFTYDELNSMEEVLCNEGLRSLVVEIRKEKEYREELGRLAREAAENEAIEDAITRSEHQQFIEKYVLHKELYHY